MDPLFVSIVGSFVRWLLTLGAAWLVSHGVWAQSDVAGYVTGLTLAVVTLIWSLVNRYKSRIKFKTALAAPAGATEADVQAKIATGMGAKVLSLVLAVALGAGLLTGCAKGSPRHQAAVASQEIGAALFALDDGERALFTAGKITPAQHKAISGKLIDVLTLGRDVNAAVLAWKPGQPAPKVLRDLLPALQRLTLDVQAMLPGDPKAETLALINSVFAAIALVLAVMV